MLRPYIKCTTPIKSPCAALHAVLDGAPCRGASRTHPSAFPPLHPHLPDPLHQSLAHLLVARALHRREIPSHLAILILLDLEHLGAARLNSVHQFADAVGVRRDPRLHLILERASTLELLLHYRPAAAVVPLLRRPQLRHLVGRELQLLLHPPA